MTTEEQIARVLKLSEAAEPGPWRDDGYNVTDSNRVGLVTPLTLAPSAAWAVNTRTLIAEYRTLAPLLARKLEYVLDRIGDVAEYGHREAVRLRDEIEAMNFEAMQ